MRSVSAFRQVPRTSHLPFPGTGLMRTARRVGLPALRRMFDIHVYDEAFIPARGPVIIAANHIGTLDGPLVALVPPRPVFALAKNELFSGVVGWGLSQAGQIPLARDYADVWAIRRAIHVLRCGKALAIFPEGARGAGTCEDVHGGVGYLALVTGAPVVPCAFLGTRIPGTHRSSIPPRGSSMHVVFGRPLHVEARPFPRRPSDVAEAMELIGPALREHVRQAEIRTGMSLPGHAREDMVAARN